jgi:hypothetical protein
MFMDGGNYGVLAALYCEQNGVNVAGFVDSKASQIKTKLGLPVLTFEQARMSADCFFIIAVKSENAQNEIKSVLTNAGLVESRDFEVSKIIELVENEPKEREKFLAALKQFDQEPRSFDCTGQAASDLIYKYLTEDKPCMIARLGGNELTQVVTYLCQKKRTFQQSFRQLKEFIYVAGFFNASQENLNKFAELMLSCMPKVDVLGSWMSCGTQYEFGDFWNYETYVKDYLRKAQFVWLGDLGGFHERPWTRALENKNVLVIHPFEESIKKQYQKRELLFPNIQMLPDFNLQTLKPVQSITGIKVPYKDWFEALNHMKEQVAGVDFDIAIIGCGAYGFPLAAFVKDMGKKSVHLGGHTQILFGIRGRRWDERAEQERKDGIANGVWGNLFNEHWIYPSKSETPERAAIVENGAYW